MPRGLDSPGWRTVVGSGGIGFAISDRWIKRFSPSAGRAHPPDDG